MIIYSGLNPILCCWKHLFERWLVHLKAKLECKHYVILIYYLSKTHMAALYWTSRPLHYKPCIQRSWQKLTAHSFPSK